MNILMMSLLYPEDQLKEVAQNAKDKLQNQINSYQRAFVQGIRENLADGEKLSILNCLPVGIFPLQYKQLFLKAGTHDNGSIHQLGCLNLPWFKQQMRAHAAAKALADWAAMSPNNRTVLVYTQYLPYMQAIRKVKKRFPDLKAAVIVTDLPNELGLASGRRGLMKKLEYRMGRQSLQLCREMDGFVLLTAPMAEAIGIGDKPHVVIEGLIQEKASGLADLPEEEERPSVLYTGTLEPGLGIAEMLEAFQQTPEIELWICGQGSMRAQVEQAARSHDNIRFYGFVSQSEALALQAKAGALINPRQASGVFTRYSFPSKTLEYMRSGKPVLCCRLEGIPEDYDPYLEYIPQPGSNGIRQAVTALFARSAAERKAMGEAAQCFVLQAKNPKTQCQRLMGLLRRL